MAEKFVPAVRKMKNPVCTGFFMPKIPGRAGRIFWHLKNMRSVCSLLRCANPGFDMFWGFPLRRARRNFLAFFPQVGKQFLAERQPAALGVDGSGQIELAGFDDGANLVALGGVRVGEQIGDGRHFFADAV